MEPSNQPGMYINPAEVEAPQETGGHSLLIDRGFDMNPDPGIAPGGCRPHDPEPHLPVDWLPTLPAVEPPHMPWDIPAENVPFFIPCMPVA